MGNFSSVFWCLLVPLLFLFNFPSSACSLVHHEVWIIVSPLLQVVKELSLHNYFNLQISLCRPNPLSDPSLALSPSSSLVRSWSHHRRSLLDTGIFSAPRHSSYIGQFAIYSTIVACHFWIYYFIGHSSTASESSATNNHSHTPSLARQYGIPVIIQATPWWNPSITFRIVSVTNQLSLP